MVRFLTARKALFALLLCATLFLPSLTYAHGGGLDGYGGHHDRKRRGYHVHQGPLAGKSYPSQAAMMEDLKKQGAGEKAGDGTICS